MQVRIAFEALDPRILPDMGVKVSFLAEAEHAAAAAPSAQPTTLVPKASVQSESGGTFVFVVRGDAVARQAVKTGGADGDRVEVLAGLHAGDRVVVTPPKELKDGTKVIVK